MGDGWNEPRDYEFDPCKTCWPEELCPSCSTRLSVVDAYLLCSNEYQPCPFCGWTQKLGYVRVDEWEYDDYDAWTFADHDWEGEG